jgi:regulator of replication initiation timing
MNKVYYTVKVYLEVLTLALRGKLHKDYQRLLSDNVNLMFELSKAKKAVDKVITEKKTKKKA